MNSKEGGEMVGVIRTKEVVTRFGLIWREFGPACATRCLGAIVRGRPTTFLDLAFDTRRRYGVRAKAEAAGKLRPARRHGSCPCLPGGDKVQAGK
jgi:hypothetical protein